MAVKKKKKDKKVKKVIQVNFETSRLTSGLDFRKAQIELYEKASIEEIEDAMNYHGILLHADQVVSDYKPVINVDYLEEKYHEQYHQELDALNKKRLVMDEDCIYCFITKVIEANFDISQLPDPEYIVDHLNRYFEQDSKVEYLIQILQNIYNVRNYSNEKNIQKLFFLTGFDVEEMLVDIICQDVINLDLTRGQVEALMKNMVNIIEYYEMSKPVYIYTDLVELLARQGIEASEEAFKKGKELFLNKQINLYNSMLAGLSEYAKEHEEVKDIMKQYYQEAQNIERHGTNDKEIFKLMQEHFGYLINE